MPAATSADLIGTWPHCYRFLHPATMMRNGEPVPMRWAELVRPGSEVDLAVADWFHVSGHRLHYPKNDAVFSAEPGVGPDPDVTPVALASLLHWASTEVVLVGEWVGYGRVGVEVADAEYLGVQVFLRQLHVWMMGPQTASGLATSFDPSNTPGRMNVIPDRIWDRSLQWILATDTDIASTYCGTQCAMDDRWPSSLEWAVVGDATPIS